MNQNDQKNQENPGKEEAPWWVPTYVNEEVRATSYQHALALVMWQYWLMLHSNTFQQNLSALFHWSKRCAAANTRGVFYLPGDEPDAVVPSAETNRCEDLLTFGDYAASAYFPGGDPRVWNIHHTLCLQHITWHHDAHTMWINRPSPTKCTGLTFVLALMYYLAHFPDNQPLQCAVDLALSAPDPRWSSRRHLLARAVLTQVYKVDGLAALKDVRQLHPNTFTFGRCIEAMAPWIVQELNSRIQEESNKK